MSTLNTRIVCSDEEGPSAIAWEKLDEYFQDGKVEFREIDALSIDYDSHYFDFVVFKSVLGSLANGQLDRQKKALQEMHRVLKPGGVLFFAENMIGSVFHEVGRRLFVPWSKSWRYMEVAELEDGLEMFKKKTIRSTGFFALFVPDRFSMLKRTLSFFDYCFGPVIPASWKYVSYGYAIK